MRIAKFIFLWIFKLALLLVLFFVFFILGSMAMTALPADAVSEPGPVYETTGLFIYAFAHVLIIVFLIL